MTADPTPVTLADTATQAWRAAAEMQAAATPEHGEFYALAGELVGTSRALGQLVDTLHGQVARYGEGRVLRDDEDWEPDVRLTLAMRSLRAARGDLRDAAENLNTFWSAIGHIGVEPGAGT